MFTKSGYFPREGVSDIHTVIKRCAYPVFDGSRKPEDPLLSLRIGPGTYTLERIPNPMEPGTDDPWLVIKGTKIGQREIVWRSDASMSKDLPVVEVGANIYLYD